MDICLIPFSEGSKWGYKNQKGQTVIEPRFDEAGVFHNGLAKVMIGNQVSYIDKSGKIIGQPEINDAAIQAKTASSINNVDNINCNPSIDTTNNNLQTNYLGIHPQNLIRIRIADKYGYMDDRRKVIIPARFSQAWHFSEGLALVQIGYKWGYINNTGQEVIKFQFDWAESFHQGIARVRVAKKYGYINQLGEVVIPIKFDSIEKFFEELALVKIGCKWGYINRTGELVIECQFDQAKNFDKGKASVVIGKNKRFIDKNGKFIS